MNVKKQTITITKPIDRKEELMDSIPINARITSINESTKTIRVTYVIDNTLSNEMIIKLNADTVKPIKLSRKIYTSSQKQKRVNCLGNAMALINIADFHLNRLIFGNEGYDRDYNIKLANDVFCNIISECIIKLKASPYHIDKIILNTCGDFLNSDTIGGTTTAGTPQTNDVTWKQAFYNATGLLEYAIKELSVIAPIDYLYIAGNHDEQVGFYLTSWLWARFRDVKNINILDNPKPRKVVEYKKNLLMITHGATEGGQTPNLPFVEPEMRDKISKAFNVEVISGHLHSHKMVNKNGVLWEVCSSSCPIEDDWTYGKAFDKPKGEVTINYYDEYSRIQQDMINTNRIYDRLVSKKGDK